MKDFFYKIWQSLSNWFFEGKGWLHIVAAIGVIILGFIIIKIIISVTRTILNKSKLKGLAGNFIITVIKVLLFFIYLIAVMKTVGIDTSGIVAILAASSLALSLALQTTLSNFAGGMILVSNHPFKKGDFVEANGISGTVEEITLFNTKLKTTDNKVVTIPNSLVAGEKIVNYSTEPKRRVDLTFNVAYGSDMDLVKNVIVKVLDGHELILHDDGYTVRLSAHGESALTFICRCWVKSENYWSVYFDVIETVTEKFAFEGIKIPYNKLDVNIVKSNEEKL